MQRKIRWRGVNLGGWLVLEKWMTPSLFSGLGAVDEHGFCLELGKDAASILQIHRTNFITEADFKWIADHGLNAVRIPVGYWIFGRAKPYVGGIEYLDQALVWADKYGLDVIIDLHGAPGSQNGKDHSGEVGKIRWTEADNIAQTVETLEKLAERYAGLNALAGIQLINEPSWRLGQRTLIDFYQQGYHAVRRHCGPGVAVIVSDAFKPKRWDGVLNDHEYQNVLLDVHCYQAHSWLDRHRSVSAHLRRCLTKRQRLLHSIGRNQKLIVGEWSAALPAKVMARLQPEQANLAYKTYLDTQLLVQAEALGWFYWSYKTENPGVWSYRECYRRGWLPKRYD